MGRIKPAKPRKPREHVVCTDVTLSDGTVARVRGTAGKQPTAADLETIEAFAAFLRSRDG